MKPSHFVLAVLGILFLGMITACGSRMSPPEATPAPPVQEEQTKPEKAEPEETIPEQEAPEAPVQPSGEEKPEEFARIGG